MTDAKVEEVHEIPLLTLYQEMRDTISVISQFREQINRVANAFAKLGFDPY